MSKYTTPLKEGLATQREYYHAQYATLELLLTKTEFTTEEDKAKAMALLEKVREGKESYDSLYTAIIELIGVIDG
jgi:hypothetical protein